MSDSPLPPSAPLAPPDPEPEVVATAASTTRDMDALQALEEVKVRSYADVVALHRQLLEEQKAVMRELAALKDDNKRLTAELVERNAALQQKLELVARIEENQHPPAHEVPHPADAGRKVKKPFSPLGFLIGGW
jgi:hypothetical protein